MGIRLVTLGLTQIYRKLKFILETQTLAEEKERLSPQELKVLKGKREVMVLKALREQQLIAGTVNAQMGKSIK
tara:strand:+ start:67 stop:285 length:219 start_codon:yes stop_codon:yes gene_type:complete